MLREARHLRLIRRHTGPPRNWRRSQRPPLMLRGARHHQLCWRRTKHLKGTLRSESLHRIQPLLPTAVCSLPWKCVLHNRIQPLLPSSMQPPLGLHHNSTGSSHSCHGNVQPPLGTHVNSTGSSHSCHRSLQPPLGARVQDPTTPAYSSVQPPLEVRPSQQDPATPAQQYAASPGTATGFSHGAPGDFLAVTAQSNSGSCARHATIG